MRWLDPKRFESASDGRFPYSVSLLSWAYNEEENIVEFLGRAKSFMDRLGCEYEHLLIDDCSSDRTLELARSFQAGYPQLRIIRNERNMNTGWNTRIAIREARNEILFWQMVDWSYDISGIGDCFRYFRDYDVLQGVRLANQRAAYLEKVPLLGRVRVKRRSDNLIKAVISVGNYLLIRALFRVPLLDFQNVTVYPTKLAQSIEFESHTAFTNPEAILKAYWKGARIKQVPVNFIRRQKGEAKGTRPKAVVAAAGQVVYYWWKWMVLGRRPDRGKGTISPPCAESSASLENRITSC